jgi:uncharacterized protein
MTPLMIGLLCVLMVATSFLSGIFGMAGGLVLIGVLLFIMPLPAAMVLHAITQMASNGWRALLWYKHIRWRTVGTYICGCAVALLGWSLWQYVPSKPVALLMLGLTPFLARLMPADFRPNPDSALVSAGYGIACTTLMLLTGATGPLLDQYFLGGKLERREIIATKATCQVFGHSSKLLYFGAIVEQNGAIDPLMAVLAVCASMIGTTLSKRALEAMSDAQFRTWAQRIITTVSGYYVLYGSYLLLKV